MKHIKVYLEHLENDPMVLDIQDAMQEIADDFDIEYSEFTPSFSPRIYFDIEGDGILPIPDGVFYKVSRSLEEQDVVNMFLWCNKQYLSHLREVFKRGIPEFIQKIKSMGYIVEFDATSIDTYIDYVRIAKQPQAYDFKITYAS